MDIDTKLWNTKESFFTNNILVPNEKNKIPCVQNALSVLTKQPPEYFQNDSINTQNPITWSDSLKPFNMKLAYVPFDVRKLKYYMDELIELNDLFLLCYYRLPEPDFMYYVEDSAQSFRSHVVILHKDKIIDSLTGEVCDAKLHECNEFHTKRLFRVVPIDYNRGL